jgi:hypothetical protein
VILPVVHRGAAGPSPVARLHRLLRLLLSVALLGATGSQAHEFWVLPHAFQLPAAGPGVSLTLTVGENFAGEPVAF